MRRILVVEDNEQSMYLISFILTNSGYEVIQATCGQEAVELAVEQEPDLILMDIQLPDIDGMEATRRIRDSESDGDVPIVAITSYAMAGDRERILAAGCTGYIEKPIIPETFLSEIAQHLQRPRTVSSPRSGQAGKSEDPRS